jgi:hypothetical protein
MRAEDIPDFIYRGAIVSVDGREEVVKEFSLQAPVISGRPVKGAQSLYLEFASGLAMEYDVGRIREIPDMAPGFIKIGARIFCKDPVPANVPNANMLRAANGEWEIVNFHFETRQEDNERRLRLFLKRPGMKEGILSREFNPRTITPCHPDPLVPVYQLPNDLAVGKPLALRPR